MSLAVSRSRFLAVARALALVSPLAACGGSQAPLANAGAGADAGPTTTASTTPTTEGADPTVGTGPCRCSWETNAAAAPRVCKKGEPSHEGVMCVPGGSPPTYEGGMMPPIGPLSPPEMV